ncbi:MAG: fumarate hydratase [bacterium]|nr:fumarate hydratase [bacterium]
MRIIEFEKIKEEVKKLYIEECIEVRKDYKLALQKALENETAPLAKEVIKRMLENYEIAEKESIPMCQDTGYPVFFVEYGSEVFISGGSIYDAINKGVEEAVKDGYLRASIVKSPIYRVNTKTNTPAIIHIDFVNGTRLKITGIAKGGGSENRSRTYMLNPNDGVEGIKNAVIDAVKKAGPDACPPFVVGVGIGGSFDYVGVLAKKALLREIGSNNPIDYLDKLEKELLEDINKLGIGPQGLGGATTALGVFIVEHPCHIASLPVAVNIQCNAHRVKTIEI